MGSRVRSPPANQEIAGVDSRDNMMLSVLRYS